jgi:CheY-like chemotaxis protein
MMYTAHIQLAMAGPKAPPAGLDRPSNGAGASVQRLRILIVEDDTIIAWTLETLLQDLGHEVVDIAASGEHALRLAREFQPELIMMDINLGSGMDGIETARNIKGFSSAQVVFVSAYGDPDTRARVQSAVPGAPLLTKPVAPDELERMISRIRRPSN